MHICIVGAGAAGWLACHHLKNLPTVKKITIIGSPVVPKIGVGESTTLYFYRYLSQHLHLSESQKKKFLVDIDAAIKCGVSYQGWSEKPFLHHFLGQSSSPECVYTNGYLLGARDQNLHHHDYAVPLHKQIYNNRVCIDSDLQGYSYHFDANKFISAMQGLAEQDHRICYVSDTVVDLVYQDNKASHIVLESNSKIHADYFISCVGQTGFNQRIFKEKYISYSSQLLTNKALFCPLEYTDRVAEFHPYTVAKTMPHGWRWITPTQSRIGTGYVFSDNHVSVDQAVAELRADTGIPDLEPFVVDFYPRRVERVFKQNTCTLGMASGFQEPLDAPGLSMTMSTLQILEQMFINYPDLGYSTQYIDGINTQVRDVFDFWCSFILHQYKTCWRSDTDFWQDHKSVEWDVYNQIIKYVFDPPVAFDSKRNRYYTYHKKSCVEPWMFYNTTSGKGIPWEVKCDLAPAIVNLSENHHKTIDHRAYFDNMKA